MSLIKGEIAGPELRRVYMVRWRFQIMGLWRDVEAAGHDVPHASRAIGCVARLDNWRVKHILPDPEKPEYFTLVPEVLITLPPPSM